MTTKALLCPSCRRAVPPWAENRCFPFCSERCRAIDLGKWLGEEYRIVARSVDEDEDGEVAVESAPHDA
jgi:hypothetical protein